MFYFLERIHSPDDECIGCVYNLLYICRMCDDDDDYEDECEDYYYDGDFSTKT